LSKIPEEDIIGVTVLLLTCSYQGQEFIRVGYYVSNEYVELSSTRCNVTFLPTNRA
jgi:histone chaperone ASF1